MAYDVRGRGISTHDAFLIGRAVGSELKGSCFVAWDCRETSPLLAQHLIEGLRSSGINVTKGGLMPGPAAYFNTFNKYDFGVFITASHNPPEYNGFKFILRDGTSLDPSILLRVKQRFINYDFNKASAVPVKQDITALNDYIRFLKDEFGKLNIKCVIDCFNGAVSVVSDSVFKQLLNAEVINDQPLSDFGGRNPEPSEHNLKELQARVVEAGASFGVGLDGDGDRSVFIDDKGRVIDGNLMTMLFAKHLLKQHGSGVIVAPVSVSKMLEQVVKPLNGKVVWCKVGHTFIEKEIVKHNALFGGEFSSHFYFNKFYPFSDGILSTLMLARLLINNKASLSNLLSELPRVFVVKDEVEFSTHEEKSRTANLLINNFLASNPDALTMDGIKFFSDDASVLLRESQTRHTIKAFVEAGSKELADKVLSKYINIVKSFRK